MDRFWTFLTYIHSFSGPAIMLLYPLYASVQAIETEDKLDDEQWLAYWILYSFLTLMDMVLEPILRWVPIWYEMKVLLVAWLVLPQFRGAAFIYDKFVRKQLRKYGVLSESSSSSSSSSPPSKSKSKSKNKYLGLVTSKKGEQEE
ncbi:HVA22-like protein e [Asparagus officinalis]|uniref:HVA22-like protein e n=1 Tax=Asparagus officinalis TaxID=4686 RepID=UPI00098DFB8D|nr:HVA22-like protein e [Asparagus officinalis]